MSSSPPVAVAPSAVPLAARVVPSLVIGLGVFLSSPNTPLVQRIVTAAVSGWLVGLVALLAYGIALKIAHDLLKQSPPSTGMGVSSPPFVAGVLLAGAVWSLVSVTNAAHRSRIERCLADASAQGVQWTSPIAAYLTCDRRASDATASRNTD